MKAKMTTNSKGKPRVKVSMTVKESELIMDLLGSISGGHDDTPLILHSPFDNPIREVRDTLDNLYYALRDKEECQ